MVNFQCRDWMRWELVQCAGSMDQLAGIKALVAADGTTRGNRVFNLYTGSGLTFTVLADRALDISTCHYHGMPLASEVHPAYYEAQGLGWLRSFPSGLFAIW